MRNIEDILLECFDLLAKTENVEKIERVDALKTLNVKYIQKWLIKPIIEVDGSARKVDLYFCFLPTFPYSWPDVYFFDQSYDYLTHIGYDDRKLCLVSSNAIPFVDNPYSTIIYLLNQAKILLTENIRGNQRQEYKSEILDYWRYQYPNESSLGIGYVLGESLDKAEGRAIKIVVLDTCQLYYIEGDEEAQHIYDWIYETNKQRIISEYEALYITNLDLPELPPYNITIGKILDELTDDEKKNLKHIINKNVNNTASVIFPLYNTDYYGAVLFKIPDNISKGYRVGVPFQMNALSTIRTLSLKRFKLFPYSTKRISKRTSGTQSEPHEYLVAGVGSVGSNLLYFLESEQNVNFTLIDDDILTSDNIGRHLLGFSDIRQYKVIALRNFLKNKHPERVINTYNIDVKEYFAKKSLVKIPTTIFLCTGNNVADMYVIDFLQEHKINCPVFILSLEPFAIAGHMLYINVLEGFDIHKLMGENVNNLVALEEYQNEDKKELFNKQEAGCGNQYTNYGGSDVILFLSAMYPIIKQLIKKPYKSTEYRWVGNVNIAKEKGIKLSTQELMEKGQIQNFPL